MDAAKNLLNRKQLSNLQFLLPGYQSMEFDLGIILRVILARTLRKSEDSHERVPAHFYWH